jgi:Mce-associated membrane protein
MVTMKLIKRTDKDVFDSVLEKEEDEPALQEDKQATDLAGQKAVEPPDADSQEDAAEAGAPDEEADGSPDGAASEPAEGARPRRWLRRVLIGATAAAAAAVLGIAGFLGWQVEQQNDIRVAGKAALAVAQSYAATLTSIDPANVDANFDQVLNGATGEFKDMYSQSASQLRQVLIDNKATSKGIVVDSAIKSATKTRVEVLLFIDQSITNTVNPQPRIDRSRVAMTMELVDKRWLASKVDIK